MPWVKSGLLTSRKADSSDPLADVASGIFTHMKADHVDAIILLTVSHAWIEATGATMTSVDRLGFSLRSETNDGVKGDCDSQQVLAV